MELTPKDVLKFYYNRGTMENFIKESKNGFNFTSSKIINANRLQLHILAYNLFNWCRCLVLPKSMKKKQTDTI